MESISSSKELFVYKKKKKVKQVFLPVPQQLSFLLTSGVSPCFLLFELHVQPPPGPYLWTHLVTPPLGGCNRTQEATLVGLPFKIAVLLPTGCVYIYLPSAYMPYYQLYHLAAAGSQTHCPVVPGIPSKA